MGTSEPVRAAFFAHESPHDLAQRLIAGTKLADPEQRHALLDGGAAAIAASDDPLIAYARDLWEPRAREVREDYEANVAAVLTMNAGLIDQARYAASGGTASPDATFTPRAAVGRLAADIQQATGDSVTLAYVDQGYTGGAAAHAAAAEGIALQVVKLPEAKRGFVLLPRHWVVERSFA